MQLNQVVISVKDAAVAPTPATNRYGVMSAMAMESNGLQTAAVRDMDY